MRFEFATASRILFGPGSVREVPQASKEMGRHAIVVTGLSTERSSSLIAELDAAGIAYHRFSVDGEPTVDLICRGVQQTREEQCDLVIGFGGGSAIDAAKAIAALAANSGEMLDYLEVIGKGRPLAHPSIPWIAIPTTAGTGAEVTRNAVLASPEHRVKVSLRSPLMLPRLAVIDPELTLNLPPAITARTGLDALTQLIEPYVSARANPMTDGYCLEGMRCVSRSLRRAYQNGADWEARTDMALASLMGGLALANAGLGVVHGFAGPIGGMFPAPHGAVCAALLPHGMDINIRALRARAPASEALKRYTTIAHILMQKDDATADDGVQWVKQLCHDLGIPPLGSYGIDSSHIQVLVEKASKASSMKGNPLQLTSDELGEVLTRAL